MSIRSCGIATYASLGRNGATLALVVVLLSPCMVSAPVVAGHEQSERSAAAPDEEDSDLQDLICGPRCVQYLLKHYGRADEDLIDLTREIQWPDLEAGASLEAIDTALRKRGIYTYGMQLAPEARLKWPFPVLLHVTGAGEDVGHYVVWLPSSSSGKTDLWCGLRAVRREPERELASRRSGAVLLTAPDPITDPESAVERAALSPSCQWVFAGGIVCVVLGLFCARRYLLRWFTC